MSRQLSNLQSLHLPTDARIEWGEPHYQEVGNTWVVDLEASGWPHSLSRLTFFGTEEQVRAIAGGWTEPEAEAVDPAQLDALAVVPATEPPRDGGLDFPGAVNHMLSGMVARW